MSRPLAEPAHSPPPTPPPTDDALHRALLRDLITAGSAWVTCAGHSMEPTIRRGDQVRIRPCPRVRAGDVVLFESPRGHVLHRALLRVPGTDWFLHIGDAGSGDGPGLAHIDRVVGRADVPRRRPSPALLWAGARRLARAGGRQGRASLRRAVAGRQRA